jgi:FkbM family methyltransferase
MGGFSRADALKTLLGKQDLVVADVGAAYGLPSHLRVLESVATILFFEPNEARAKELSESYSALGQRIKVCPVALSANGGERVLYETNTPTGSSLLKPGSEAGIDWMDPQYFFPVREHLIQTSRLQDVLKDQDITRLDFLKIDVQGGEGEVLHGLGHEHARRILGVELEIGFPGGYQQQPSFAGLNELLESHDLVLFDLKPVRGHRHLAGARTDYVGDVFGVTPDAPSVSKRLWEADAVYFRSARSMLDAGDIQAIRRLIALYCAYGFFTEAHYLVARVQAAALVSDPLAAELQQAVVAWHRHGRYAFTDSLAWQRWTERLSSVAARLKRRLVRRRLAGWLD